ADGGDGDERHHDDVLGHALAVFPAPKASFPAEDQLLHGGSPFAPPMVAGSVEDRPSVERPTLTYGPRRLEPNLRNSVLFDKDRGAEWMRDKDRIALSDRHNARGIELADHGMLDEAAKEFRKAIELDPESAHAYDNLGTVLAEKQLYREALSCYLTAIRLEPDAPTAHYNLASFLGTHGLEMAAEEYREAIDLDPEYPDAHLNLGITYADLGKVKEAEQAFERAIELAPDDPLPRQE